MKWKIKKYQLRIIIKANNILHKLRCIGMLSQEQLECLEKVAVSCVAEDRETILSIIHEFGPYCGKLT